MYGDTVVGGEGTDDDAAISYVVLNLGPIERGVGTVRNHLRSIGYFYNVRGGVGPLKGMAMLQNLTRGATRRKGPSQRKMPVTADDLGKIYDATDWGNPDSATLWCSVDISWFSC